MTSNLRERYQRIFARITIVLALVWLVLIGVASASESFAAIPVVLRTAFVATLLVAGAFIYLRSVRHYRMAAGICGAGLLYLAVSAFWASLWPQRIFALPLVASVLFAFQAGWAFLLAASETRQ